MVKAQICLILKKLAVAGQKGFVFSQTNEPIIKIYSHQRCLNINCYLKFQIPVCLRQFFRVISQNRQYVEVFCDNVETSFHFACQKWFDQLKKFVIRFKI